MTRDDYIRKLLDIQELCSAEIREHPLNAYQEDGLAEKVLGIIRG